MAPLASPAWLPTGCSGCFCSPDTPKPATPAPARATVPKAAQLAPARSPVPQHLCLQQPLMQGGVQMPLYPSHYSVSPFAPRPHPATTPQGCSGHHPKDAQHPLVPGHCGGRCAVGSAPRSRCAVGLRMSHGVSQAPEAPKCVIEGDAVRATVPKPGADQERTRLCSGPAPQTR